MYIISPGKYYDRQRVISAIAIEKDWKYSYTIR